MPREDLLSLWQMSKCAALGSSPVISAGHTPRLDLCPVVFWLPGEDGMVVCIAQRWEHFVPNVLGTRSGLHVEPSSEPQSSRYPMGEL